MYSYKRPQGSCTSAALSQPPRTSALTPLRPLASAAAVVIVARTMGFRIELSPTVALTPSDPVKEADDAAS
jgi:hypothetical protein